jgi:hypothetical protein
MGMLKKLTFDSTQAESRILPYVPVPNGPVATGLGCPPGEISVKVRDKVCTGKNVCRMVTSTRYLTSLTILLK